MKSRFLISCLAFLLLAGTAVRGEEWKSLSNGVSVPAQWPPHYEMNYSPMPLPYMDKIPAVIDINLGRQLFVDEYLISSSTLNRTAHFPKKASFNPIIKPETELEMKNPYAAAKDGGVWWDSDENIFKMWYDAGWMHSLGYAVSTDGIHWTRSVVNEKTGTNAIVEDITADSSTIWIDWFTDDPAQKYKMFLRPPNTDPRTKKKTNTAWCLVSADGIHWEKRVPTGPCGDRSTIFYNPFIGKWVFSLRNNGNVNKCEIGRHRRYVERADFMDAMWTKEDAIFWLGADNMDAPDPYAQNKAQLYNLSAIAYESIMIALPQIHLGPANELCNAAGVPKITDLKVAYSRDGFHWDRSDRGAFIRSERMPGCWDRGYVQTSGGLFNIVGDQLWFHYAAYPGREQDPNYVKGAPKTHVGGATGMAVLRRDGFVSRDAGDKEGYLVTRPVKFNGEYLFVNVDCPGGCLFVEVLDERGKVIDGFSRDECKALKVNSTIAPVTWKKSLAELRGKNVRFRFILRSGSLYAFWVSQEKNGASHGYTAAGGPGLIKAYDTTGMDGYKVAKKYMLKKY